MFKWVKEKLVSGFMVPMILDNQTGKPSITLSYSIVTFCVTIVLLYGTTVNKVAILPCLVSMLFWFLATVLYIIRKINKASFDLDDKKLSLENTTP